MLINTEPQLNFSIKYRIQQTKGQASELSTHAAETHKESSEEIKHDFKRLKTKQMALSFNMRY